MIQIKQHAFLITCALALSRQSLFIQSCEEAWSQQQESPSIDLSPQSYHYFSRLHATSLWCDY